MQQSCISPIAMSEPPSKKQRTGIEDASKTAEGSRVLAVLGLGNPGGSCKRERHSLGARVAAALVQEHKSCSSPESKENKDRLTASFASPFCIQINQKSRNTNLMTAYK